MLVIVRRTRRWPSASRTDGVFSRVLPARQPGAVVVAVDLVDQAGTDGGVGPEPAGARVQYVAG